MTGPVRERIEKARLGARSAARDLLRLVRALDAHGVDLEKLGGPYREALEQCNHQLATALTVVETLDGSRPVRALREMETTIADTHARLRATRSAILDDLGKGRRLQVLEAMLAVRIADEDLEVEPSEHDCPDCQLADALDRAEKEVARARRGEAKRRRAELQAITAEAPAARLYATLPRPWLIRVAREVGARTPGPVAIARRLLGGVDAIVDGLRPGERTALRALLAAEGVMLARAFEQLYGDASHDGYEWHREPPTSVMGRLRARGLCVVGRSALGTNRRSRPRVVVVPRELRPLLRRALAAAAPPPRGVTVPVEVIRERMDGEEREPGAIGEAESLRFARAQPELAEMAGKLARGVSRWADPAALVGYVAEVWSFYEVAHEGRLPRLRSADLMHARASSSRDLAAVEHMHEKLLERRVGTMIASQPHMYAYLAGALDDLPWPEEDKLLVFHACDTAMRAFDRALAG